MPVFLFVLESIGTQELILIAIAALVLFGPRKLPEIGRTLGKYLADFRRVSDEFKNTWQTEVELEEATERRRKTVSDDAPVTSGDTNNDILGLSVPASITTTNDASDDSTTTANGNPKDDLAAPGDAPPLVAVPADAIVARSPKSGVKSRVDSTTRIDQEEPESA